MKTTKLIWRTAKVAACAALFLVGAFAAQQPKAKPLPAKATAVKTASQAAWPSETLSGKITMVNSNSRILVMTNSEGVPFDMHVTKATSIRSGNRPVTLNALAKDMQKNVTVRFTPERSGDMAKTIQLQG